MIADIGGGVGSQLEEILRLHPSCRGILFDQPDVVARAIPHDRIERVGGSFFESMPAQADAYILRQVIHDWDEEQALAILKCVRAAAKTDSLVILIEYVVPETSEYSYSKWIDLHMLLVAGGRERTASEYRQSLAQASLEMEQIISTPTGISLVIGRPH